MLAVVLLKILKMMSSTIPHAYAVREERWADALLAWIEETGKGVDVFDESPDVWDSEAKIWTEQDLRLGVVLDRLEGAPLFVPLSGPPDSATEELR